MNASKSSPLAEPAAARRKRLRKLIVTVILVSLGLHVVVSVGAGLWIIARYFSQPKAEFVARTVQMPVDERNHQLALDEVQSLRPRASVQNRIQSLRPTRLALPELPKMPVDTSLPFDPQAIVADDMSGLGSSAGTGAGAGSGQGNAVGGFFGGTGLASSGLLEGTFYDLKQTLDGRPTEMGAPEAPISLIFPILKQFSRNWNPAPFRKYYQGSDKLYTSQLSIPQLRAEVGPKEFGLGRKVEPKFWVVHYKGRVVAPKTGQFRFVGAGDDTLLVRFDHKNVLDAGFWPTWRSGNAPVLSYGAKGDHFKATGCEPGYIIGEPFRVEEGKTYDIEILLSEYGGELFQGVLLIQDMSKDYRKAAGTDSPILPLFKLAPSNMEAKDRANLPPYDRDAPIWKPAFSVETRTGPGIPSGFRH